MCNSKVKPRESPPEALYAHWKLVYELGEKQRKQWLVIRFYLNLIPIKNSAQCSSAHVIAKASLSIWA